MAKTISYNRLWKLLIDKNFKDMEEETTDGEETPAEAEEKEEPEQESDEQDEK